MKKTLIIEDKDFIKDLEGLQYEVDSRKSIIAYMIDSNMDIHSEGFSAYQKEYTSFLKEYEEKKKEVELKFIPSTIKNPKFWNLNFLTGELIVEC